MLEGCGCDARICIGVDGVGVMHVSVREQRGVDVMYVSVKG